MKRKQHDYCHMLRHILFWFVFLWASGAVANEGEDATLYITESTDMLIDGVAASQDGDVAVVQSSSWQFKGLSDVVIYGQTVEGKWFKKQTITTNGSVEGVHYVGPVLMARFCDHHSCSVLVFEQAQARYELVQSIEIGSRLDDVQWLLTPQRDEVFLAVDGLFYVYRRGPMGWVKQELLSSWNVQDGYIFAANEDDLFVAREGHDELFIYARRLDGSWGDLKKTIRLLGDGRRFNIVIDGDQALVFFPGYFSSDLLLILDKESGSWRAQSQLSSVLESSHITTSVFMKDGQIVIYRGRSLAIGKKNNMGEWSLTERIVDERFQDIIYMAKMVGRTLFVVHEDLRQAYLSAFEVTPEGVLSIQGPDSGRQKMRNKDFLVTPEHVFVHVEGFAEKQIEVFERCASGCTTRRSVVIEPPKDRSIAWFELLLWFDGQLFVSGFEGGVYKTFVYELVRGRWELVQTIDDIHRLYARGQSILVWTGYGLGRMVKTGGLWAIDESSFGEMRCSFSHTSKIDGDVINCVGDDRVVRLYFDDQLQLTKTKVLIKLPPRSEARTSEENTHVAMDEIWWVESFRYDSCRDLKVNTYREDKGWQKSQSIPLQLQCSYQRVEGVFKHDEKMFLAIRVDGVLLLGWFEQDAQNQWFLKGWYTPPFDYNSVGYGVHLMMSEDGSLWGRRDDLLYEMNVSDLSPWQNNVEPIKVIEHRLDVLEDQSLLLKNTAEDKNVYYQLIDKPRHGQVFDSNGQALGLMDVHHHNDLKITYKPEMNYSGMDKVSFLVMRDAQVIHMETWFIEVHSVNERPEIKPLEYTAQAGQKFDGQLIGEDPDGDALTYEIISQPPGGGVTLVNYRTGAFVYNVPEHAEGRLGFEYRAFDGKVFSTAKYVSVDVMAAPQGEPMMPDRRQRAQRSGGGSVIGCSSPFGQPVSMGSMLGLWVMVALGRRRARRRRFVDGGHA